MKWKQSIRYGFIFKYPYRCGYFCISAHSQSTDQGYTLQISEEVRQTVAPHGQHAAH